MNRLACILFVTLFLSIEGLAQATDRSFSFQGQVASSDKQPVSQCLIALTDTEDHLLAQTETDAEGNYLLAEVPLKDGEYRLHYLGVNFKELAESFTIADDSDPVSTLNVTLTSKPVSPPDELKGGTISHIRVFYGTDRVAQTTGSSTVYLNGSAAQALSYGWADVVIPPGHKAGTMNQSIFQLVFSPNADADIKISTLTPETMTSFYSDLSKAINVKGKTAFVFVHGFNVSFDDAVRRTAQMCFDMNFRGVPIAYSWPSRAILLGYKEDEKQIEATKANLKQFLTEIRTRTGATNVYLIAHSMGNRALLSVLSDLATTDPKFLSSVKEVISAAPDVGRDDFTQFAGKIVKAAPLTLYASSRDQALRASVFLHYGEKRAGLFVGSDIVNLQGMDSIDSSLVSTDWLGHSYYGDVPSVMTDLAKVLSDQRTPRALKQGITPPKYWIIMP